MDIAWSCQGQRFTVAKDGARVDWRIKRVSLLDRLTSRVLSKLLGETEFRSADFFDGIYTKLTGNSIIPSTSGVMTDVEQRMNMYHLVSQVLAYGVEGDFVELGCNSGDSSMHLIEVPPDLEFR